MIELAGKSNTTLLFNGISLNSVDRLTSAVEEIKKFIGADELVDEIIDLPATGIISTFEGSELCAEIDNCRLKVSSFPSPYMLATFYSTTSDFDVTENSTSNNGIDNIYPLFEIYKYINSSNKITTTYRRNGILGGGGTFNYLDGVARFPGA